MSPARTSDRVGVTGGGLSAGPRLCRVCILLRSPARKPPRLGFLRRGPGTRPWGKGPPPSAGPARHPQARLSCVAAHSGCRFVTGSGQTSLTPPVPAQLHRDTHSSNPMDARDTRHTCIADTPRLFPNAAGPPRRGPAQAHRGRWPPGPGVGLRPAAWRPQQSAHTAVCHAPALMPLFLHRLSMKVSGTAAARPEVATWTSPAAVNASRRDPRASMCPAHLTGSQPHSGHFVPQVGDVLTHRQAEDSGRRQPGGRTEPGDRG